jgi:hypothetical protein
VRQAVKPGRRFVMPEASVNWSTARVEDGDLAVRLEGDIKKGWKQAFKTTVRLLGPGDWGEVTLKKGTIHVADVVPGGEDKLRHYLESVVEQANVSRSRSDGQSRSDQPDDTAAGNESDVHMTEQFRSFAEDEAQA